MKPIGYVTYTGPDPSIRHCPPGSEAMAPNVNPPYAGALAPIERYTFIRGVPTPIYVQAHLDYYVEEAKRKGPWYVEIPGVLLNKQVGSRELEKPIRTVTTDAEEKAQLLYQPPPDIKKDSMDALLDELEKEVEEKQVLPKEPSKKKKKR